MESSKVQKRTPRYNELCDLFAQRIKSGQYPPGSRLPTELEFAREHKVNPLTVSRALRQLVQAGMIVRRRGDGTYVANQLKPPLIPGRHLRIGVLWHCSVLPERMTTTFQGAMTRGLLLAWGLDQVEPEWARVGEREPTRVTWTSIERGLTIECIGESVQSRQRHPNLESIRTGRFDGLITLSIIEEPWLTDLLDLGLPTVLADFPCEKLAARADEVVGDALPGYRAAVQHFAARGLTRIHFLGSHMQVPPPRGDMKIEEVIAWHVGKERVDPDSFLRLSAYRQAMDECGLKVREEWIHFAWASTEMTRVLAQRLALLPREELPQAFVCHGIKQAQYMMEAFADHGHWVEGVGASESVSSGPALGIHIDGTRLGASAAELLRWRIQQPQRPTMRVGVPMHLEAVSVRQVEPQVSEGLKS
jgi:DNA-binding LacI/PurR family transcriptional regulator